MCNPDQAENNAAKSESDKVGRSRGSHWQWLWFFLGGLFLLCVYVLSIGPVTGIAVNMKNPDILIDIINVVYYPIMWVVDRNDWLMDCLVPYVGWWINLLG